MKHESIIQEEYNPIQKDLTFGFYITIKENEKKHFVFELIIKKLKI